MSTLNGDAPCSKCGTHENIVWFTESVFWNSVVRESPMSPYEKADAILCVRCFVALTEAVGFRPTGWRLSPEFPWATT